MTVLNPKELTQLKQNLLKLLEDLKTQYQLGKSATDTVVLDQAMVGRISRMDAMQQQKMAESNILSTQKRLKKVQIALAKFEEDEFGYCDECGDTIAFARLEIQPEADLCIGCQSMLERSK